VLNYYKNVKIIPLVYFVFLILKLYCEADQFINVVYLNNIKLFKNLDRLVLC